MIAGSTRALLAFAVLGMGHGVLAGEVRAQDRADERSTLGGIVRDYTTKAPILGASLSIAHAATPAATLARTTDQNGRFLFENLRPGLYVTSVNRVGYRTLVDTIAVASDSEVRVIFELSVSPVELEPLVVTTDMGRLAFMDGFEERRDRDRVHTAFFTRGDIEERHPYDLTRLFWMSPGVRVTRGQVRLECGLGWDVYVNGRYIGMPAMSIDDLFPPESIEAVELYTNPHEVLGEFPIWDPRRACGVLVIWTRPRDPDTILPIVRRVAMAVGAIAAAVFLTR